MSSGLRADAGETTANRSAKNRFAGGNIGLCLYHPCEGCASLHRVRLHNRMKLCHALPAVRLFSCCGPLNKLHCHHGKNIRLFRIGTVYFFPIFRFSHFGNRFALRMNALIGKQPHHR